MEKIDFWLFKTAVECFSFYVSHINIFTLANHFVKMRIMRSFIQVLFSFFTQEGALSRLIFINKINEIISSKEEGVHKTVLAYNIICYSTQYYSLFQEMVASKAEFSYKITWFSSKEKGAASKAGFWYNITWYSTQYYFLFQKEGVLPKHVSI